MKKDFISARPSGSEKNEPKVIGEVLNDYLRSNEPLAIAFRKRKAKSEAAKATEAEVETGQLFRDLFADTHLCVNLKLLTREPGLIPVGAYLDGIITRNGEDTFLFAEKAKEKKVKTVQRNPIIFAGSCVNVHLLADSTKRLEFNRPRFYSDFTFRDFCVAAAQELLTIACLLGDEDSEE
jgi:hypothetical protein